MVDAAEGGAAVHRPPAQSRDEDEVPLIWKEQKQALKGSASNESKEGGSQYNIFHYLVYAFINVIIAVPGLYGYASVIFNHPCFQPHMAKLSKLVVFSSLVHQLGFVLFSSLNFAIGTVQDAGLIFLSAMANSIAHTILNEGGTVEEVISTTLVILPLGTAALGIVLILLGYFRLLDIVSYLPMPVSLLYKFLFETSKCFHITHNISNLTNVMRFSRLSGDWRVSCIHRILLFGSWGSTVYWQAND